MPTKIENDCTTKKTFFSRKEARRKIKAMLGGYGESFRPYHCPHCKNWHLTSQEKRSAEQR